MVLMTTFKSFDTIRWHIFSVPFFDTRARETKSEYSHSFVTPLLDDHNRRVSLLLMICDILINS